MSKLKEPIKKPTAPPPRKGKGDDQNPKPKTKK